MAIENRKDKHRDLLVAAAFFAIPMGLSITPAIAETCYEVVKANSVNMRAKPRRNANVVTTVKGGTLLRKVGLPLCGLWWCKVETGSGEHVGYIGSRFLSKQPCP